jgi:glycosyltransferase involved in cell wall biosynthesis
MSITVILCTYNRCPDLPKVLDSLAASKLPSEIAWEVLVVDNNSNDRTREVVGEFCRCPRGPFRYLFEAQPGKSHALNAGIREAKGDILAFVDDDVRVEPDWLRNLTASLHGADWAGAGGRTLPEAPTAPLPRWLSLDGPYGLGGIVAALFDLGDEPHELALPPYGANMAVRTEMFKKYGGFRTDLGPSPDRAVPRPNEDTEFGRRLMAAGERIRYEPSAIVYHPIVTDRIQKQYFLDWWFDYGRAMIREWGPRPNVLGIPRCYLTIAMASGRILRDTLRSAFDLNPQRSFRRKCVVWREAGHIVETYRYAQFQRRGRDVRPASKKECRL